MKEDDESFAHSHIKPKYGDEIRKEIIRLWKYSMHLCAKRLVPFIRDNVDYLAESFSCGGTTKNLLNEQKDLG